MSSFKSILQEFIGQDRGVYIPKTFIKMTGEMGTAALLAQIIYWSQRTANPDGWFWKSAKEWDDELGISTFQINRYMKTLKQFGVETKLKKAKGAPTLHYRLNWEQLELVFNQYLENADGDWISKFLENRETDKSIYIDNNNSNSDQIQESDSHRVHTSDKSDSQISQEKKTDEAKNEHRNWLFEAIGYGVYQMDREALRNAPKQVRQRIGVIATGSKKRDDRGLMGCFFPDHKPTQDEEHAAAHKLLMFFADWRRTKPGIDPPSSSGLIWLRFCEWEKTNHKRPTAPIVPPGYKPPIPKLPPPIVTKKEPEYDF